MESYLQIDEIDVTLGLLKWYIANARISKTLYLVAKDFYAYQQLALQMSVCFQKLAI